MFDEAWMTQAESGAGVDDLCPSRCDPDCEIGPVHCYWAHEPNHKQGWHDPEEAYATAQAEDLAASDLDPDWPRAGGD
jgi:hypothetical protein